MCLCRGWRKVEYFGTKGEERKVSVCGSGWKVRVRAFVVEREALTVEEFDLLVACSVTSRVVRLG